MIIQLASLARVCVCEASKPTAHPSGLGSPVMDSSVHKNVTEKMDDNMSDGATCPQTSGAGQTKVSPETSHTPLQSPAQKQVGEGDGFVFPRRRRGKERLLAGTPVAANPNPPTPMDVTNPSTNPKPLFKQPTRVNPDFVFLWNAGGKLNNKKVPSDNSSTPKIVLINKIPIYIQKLTSAQAAANGMIGWD